MLPSRRDLILAARDIHVALLDWPLWTFLGWQDVRQRYRRSTLGPLWLTLNQAFSVLGIGLVYGNLFQIHYEQFLPYLAAGVTIWALLTATINEGAMSFILSSGFIKQMKRPLFTYILWTIWRNILIFAHTILIYVIVAAIFRMPLTINHLLLVFGFPLSIISISWVGLLAGLFSTRFRDLPAFISSILTVLFFVTPIIYKREQLGDRTYVVDFNPLTHILEVVRAPLLGAAPSTVAWVATLIIAVVGWAVTIVFYARFRARIAYWL